MTSMRTVSPLGDFCLSVAYITLLRFLWQFSFYLRTDLYYVIMTALGCVDLQNTTRAYVRHLFFTFFRRADKMEDEAQWHPRDRQVVRWYTPVYLGGYAVSIGLLLFVGAPLTIQLLSMMIAHLLHGISADPGGFLDAMIFLAFNLLPWIVLTVSIARNLQKWNSQRQKALDKSIK